MGATMHEGRIEVVQRTIDPASVAANTTAEQQFNVPGVVPSDVLILVSKPLAQAGIGICGWRVTALGLTAITFNNNTAGAIDPSAELYTFVYFRPDGTPQSSFSPR
jgi:hypothetical protein